MSISAFLVYSTLISHVVLVFLVLASIFSRSWGKEIVLFLGKRALLFSLLTALAAVSGSLIYSGVIGFAPCELCWWQRIFLYPQAVIFLIALYKKDGAIFRYTIPMSLIAGMVALYHTYIQLGGTSSLPCAAAGGACAKVFVNEFGYITIPTMSLTIVLYLLIFAWMHKLAQKM